MEKFPLKSGSFDNRVFSVPSDPLKYMIRSHVEIPNGSLASYMLHMRMKELIHHNQLFSISVTHDNQMTHRQV